MRSLWNLRILIILALISALTISCVLSVGTNGDNTELFPTSTIRQVAPSGPIEPAKVALQPTSASTPLLTTNEEAILVDLYRRVNPSVVNIITYVAEQGLVNTSGQGSGFLFDADGNIVTNSHVVHGSDQIEVIFSDGFSVDAKIIGQDLHSDLAVIKVDQYPVGTVPIPLGKIEEVAVGQTAVALGNPFGLGGTLTRGIISALGRTIPALTPFSIPQAIQTDAPINPGNSGGPLLNLAGEVIGLNAQIETDGDSRANSGVGFAIPVSIISRVVPQLIKDGKYQWSWLGVVGGNLNSTLKEAMDLSIDHGAYISEIVSDGPAEQAGLRGSDDQTVVDNRRVEIGGDIITAIDGVQVNTFDDILIYIALNTIPGQQVSLTILRNGNLQEVPLILQARPSDSVRTTSP